MKKRTIKKLFAVGLSMVMLLGTAACGAKEEAKAPAEEEAVEEEDASTEEAADEKITVGVNLFYRRDEYYADVESTFRTYGEELGYEVVITDADADVPTQISQVEDLITQGVDILCIAPIDHDALIPPLQEAVDAGIPVICYDGGLNSDEIPETKVIFDYPGSGRMVGEWACQYVDENLGGTAKMAVLDFPASTVVGIQTVDGFLEAVAEHDGIEIVAQQDGKASRVDSMAAMENILTANPDLDIVYAFNLDMCIGAANAIEAAGSDAVVCGGGWGQEGFELLENGHPHIKALAASSPVTQARDTLDAVTAVLAGEELPAETKSSATLLTQENIKDFDWRSVVEARVK